MAQKSILLTLLKKITAKMTGIPVAIFFALILGSIVGSISWLFLFLVQWSYDVFWQQLPHSLIHFFNSNYGISEGVVNLSYPAAVCTIGGLVIGLLEFKWGKRVVKFEQALGEIKQTGTYRYHKLYQVLILALIPLVFGGVIGPEAGLSCVIAGMAVWIADHFRNLKSKYAKINANICEMSIIAVLGSIFGAPLFGFIAPFDNGKQSDLLKRQKVVIYLTVTFSAFTSFAILTKKIGGLEGLPRFETIDWQSGDLLWSIPAIALGVIFGIFYSLADNLSNIISRKFAEHAIILPIISGLILGILGGLLPLSLFSGEAQMTDLINNYKTLGAIALFLIALAKVILCPLLYNTGWRGGNIFPVIFSGVAIGYAFSLLTGMPTVLAVTVCTASITGYIMRKPLMVILLLLLCFPIDNLVFVAFAAVIASLVPELPHKSVNK
ncbi:MAG: chloride channel protein [Candidatus Ancillula sp.]|jgi:H+/Cl- antiporter ClcA|nr:chloride channel protein [Candidatus Ancillula sp.]